MIPKKRSLPLIGSDLKNYLKQKGDNSLPLYYNDSSLQTNYNNVNIILHFLHLHQLKLENTVIYTKLYFSFNSSTYPCAACAAILPSPVAVTIWRSIFSRTSPAA